MHQLRYILRHTEKKTGAIQESIFLLWSCFYLTADLQGKNHGGDGWPSRDMGGYVREIGG